MTNEKILEILNKAAKCIAGGHPDHAGAFLAESIEQVKKDIITAEAKKSGKGVQQKALDGLYKSIKPYAASREQPAMAKQHKSATTGKYYITDGYTAVESDTPFSGIPEQTENPFNFSRLFPSNIGEELPPPAASVLKAWIKSEKASALYCAPFARRRCKKRRDCIAEIKSFQGEDA